MIVARYECIEWAADLPVCPVNYVAHEDVHHAQIIHAGAIKIRLAAVRK